VNVHGMRSLANNFLLDGLDNNSISENVQELTTQVSRRRWIRSAEFKVVTSGVLGRVRPVAGRRHQRHHEIGYERVPRHRIRVPAERQFNSNDFYSIRQGAAKPDHSQNDFGGNLGGPIVRARRSSSATSRRRG